MVIELRTNHMRNEHSESPTTVIFGGGGGAAGAAEGTLEYLANPAYYDEQFAPLLEEAGLEGVGVSSEMHNTEVVVGVAVADSGGSTGKMSRLTGISLGLGDTTKVIAKTSAQPEAADLFVVKFGPRDTMDTLKARSDAILEHLSTEPGFDALRSEAALRTAVSLAESLPRGEDGSQLRGHNLGNLMLYGLALDARDRGDEEPVISAIEQASEAMLTRARIMPATTARHYLEMNDGGIIVKGEHDIDVHHIQYPKIAHAYLVDAQGGKGAVPANPQLVQETIRASRLINAYGSPYTSLTPATRMENLREAYQLNKKLGGISVAYANLFGLPHDTREWCAGRFAEHVWDATGRAPDILFYNTAHEQLREILAELPEGTTVVTRNTPFLESLGIHAAGLDLTGKRLARDANDLVVDRSPAAHNGPLAGMLALSNIVEVLENRKPAYV